jgi:hypothetical protein
MRLIRLIVFGAFSTAILTAAAGETPRKYSASETAALLDMATMRDAEVWAHLDTNYLHTLENLNDLIDFDTNFYFDDIMDGGGAQVISLLTGRFHPSRLDMRQPLHVWQGPYVTFQQGRISIDGAGYDPGTPIDPWGNPYYFYTPLGLVRPTLGDITLEMYGDLFNSYAIVSLGYDGDVSEDDLIVTFGYPPPSVTTISSVNPAMTYPGRTVTVRGYQFGPGQETSWVELGGRKVDSVESWDDRTIVLRVPPWASSGDVQVIRDTRRSNRFPLLVFSRARQWTLYP